MWSHHAAVAAIFIEIYIRHARATQDSFEVVNESMDIVVTLLDRFGGVITAKGLQAKLQPALLPLLDDQRTALRKRAITCLCASCCAAFACLQRPAFVCRSQEDATQQRARPRGTRVHRS